jgi:hypothetical protein
MQKNALNRLIAYCKNINLYAALLTLWFTALESLDYDVMPGDQNKRMI